MEMTADTYMLSHLRSKMDYSRNRSRKRTSEEESDKFLTESRTVARGLTSDWRQWIVKSIKLWTIRKQQHQLNRGWVEGIPPPVREGGWEGGRERHLVLSEQRHSCCGSVSAWRGGWQVVAAERPATTHPSPGQGEGGGGGQAFI